MKKNMVLTLSIVLIILSGCSNLLYESFSNNSEKTVDNYSVSSALVDDTAVQEAKSTLDEVFTRIKDFDGDYILTYYVIPADEDGFVDSFVSDKTVFKVKDKNNFRLDRTYINGEQDVMIVSDDILPYMYSDSRGGEIDVPQGYATYLQENAGSIIEYILAGTTPIIENAYENAQLNNTEEEYIFYFEDDSGYCRVTINKDGTGFIYDYSDESGIIYVDTIFEDVEIVLT